MTVQQSQSVHTCSPCRW